MKVIDPAGRDHRTAVVVDLTSGNPGDRYERVNRLFQSVNGANIKADLFAFDGHTLRRVTNADEVFYATEHAAEMSPSLDDWATEAGYTQLVVSRGV